MFFLGKRKKDKQRENVSESIQENTQTVVEPEKSNHKADLKKEILEPEVTKQDVPVTVDKNDTVRFVRENCEAIAENERQIAEAKKEYEKVTSYLTDIQRIDMASDAERKEIDDVCKSILTLTSERNKYKNRNLTISDAQMRKFEPFEDELVDEIKKMYNAESYQTAIESDISNLKKEKENLYSQKKEVVSKQNAIKGMTKILALLIISLIVLLIVIFYALKADMTLPYLGVVFLAAVSAAALIFESQKNRRDVILIEKKINRAVTLLNKVKIKYINNINVLDYNCNKFGVKNAKDFEQKWNEYCKMREYEKKFRENTEMLNANNENLVIMLKDVGVVDTDIWLSRCVAIVDPKEMVEIRHELNQRRQMLRERIENNEQLKENIIKQLDYVINESPQIRDELIQIVKDFSNNK
ncbi:MAG: hypothetical protein ACLS49_01225 [Christensenellales bacterium]